MLLKLYILSGQTAVLFFKINQEWLGHRVKGERKRKKERQRERKRERERERRER